MLAGCGPPAAMPQTSAFATRVDRGRSWMLPEAKNEDLLYVSGIETGNVYVFTYPGGKLVGTLDASGLGFGPAFGLCTDAAGDVFMAMAEGFTLFEYAHGGTSPVAQLEDSDQLPLGCSVDRRTGNLAAADVTGNVAVFKNARGTPTLYSDYDVSEFFFCTYDDRGNLFADGEDAQQNFKLTELPKNGGTLRDITLDRSATAGFAIQWDGNDLAVQSAQTSASVTIDRVRVSGTTGKVVGETELNGSPNSSYVLYYQFWIQGRTLVEPDDANSAVGFWKFPRGGDAKKTILNVGSDLSGVTVSLAPHFGRPDILKIVPKPTRP
jgi:hypothetical protein